MSENIDETRIIEAATQRFMDTGFNKVTMDEIASDVGMSKKTVYKFFPSKETLLQVVVAIHTRNIERDVREVVQSEKKIDEKLIALLTIVGKVVRKMSRPFMADVQRFAPALWKEIEVFRREKILSQLLQMFKQAKKEGAFREDVDPDLFFLVVMTTIQGIMNPEVLSQHPFTAETAFRGIFKILYSGVLTDEARHRFEQNNLNLIL